MKLARVRMVMIVFSALALVLLPLGSALKNDAVVTAALFCFVVSAVVWYSFYRCPHCHKFLGQSTQNTCPHCGEHL